jgi:hypothetical protein
MDPMRSLPVVLVALAGCSSAPLPPRIDAALPSPRPSASASASVSIAIVPPAASAVSYLAPPDEESDDDFPWDKLGLAGNGVRLSLEDGADLVITLRDTVAPDSVPEVVMALVRGGKVLSRRDGFAAVTGVEEKILTSAQSCETWRAGIRREAFGSVSGVRVSLGCSTGEDYYTATELAVLFRLDGPLRDLDGLARIWAGPANTLYSEMELCVRSREVDFRLIDVKKLEKTITEETRWNDRSNDEDWAKALKRGCKVKKKTTRVERVALP